MTSLARNDRGRHFFLPTNKTFEGICLALAEKISSKKSCELFLYLKSFCILLAVRLSQSPSLLISGSDSWPQREGLLSTATRQIYRRHFPALGFIQSRTVLAMRRQSNPITPHGTWLELSWSNFNWTVYFFAGCISIRFIACIQIQSFSGCFIFLHLSTLPRSDFPGTHGAKKITYLFCFERAHYKVYIFLCFLS